MSAYRPEGSSALCTCQCIRFELLTLKMKIKDVEDLDENWRMYLKNVNMYVQQLALLGSAICSQYIIVNFVKDVRTRVRTLE